ncbi:MAG: selenium cofactor biosynthesis protein YqeC [Acidimicrobiia bacterium]
MTPMLRDQLGICEHELISIVGAGGKSAVLFTLGRELAIDGGRVILTTTTKMARDQVTEPVCWSADPMAAGRQLLAGSPLFVALGTIPGKVTGPTPEDVDRLFLETAADYVVVEADGARSKSVKAPAGHEPVIPGRSTLVIVVAAIDAVGRPIREVAHRPERVAALAGIPESDSLAVPDLAAVLLHAEGGLKGIPKTARVAAVITRVTPDTEQSAAELVGLLLADPRVTHAITRPITSR